MSREAIDKPKHQNVVQLTHRINLCTFLPCAPKPITQPPLLILDLTRHDSYPSPKRRHRNPLPPLEPPLYLPDAFLQLLPSFLLTPCSADSPTALPYSRGYAYCSTPNSPPRLAPYLPFYPYIPVWDCVSRARERGRGVVEGAFVGLRGEGGRRCRRGSFYLWSEGAPSEAAAVGTGLCSFAVWSIVAAAED